MYKFSRFICIVSLVFSGFSSFAATDDRLMGNWQGQRNQDGKCSFMAWEISRTKDGIFKIFFFKDPEKKQILGEEKGRWETEGDKLFLFTEGVPTPDIYQYVFVDENSVNLSNLKRDPSADCMADYEFTDHRISR